MKPGSSHRRRIIQSQSITAISGVDGRVAVASVRWHHSFLLATYYGTRLLSLLSASAEPPSQFHHAIPRFLLKFFAKRPEGSNPHVVQYSIADGRIIEPSVSRIFGQHDLYIDHTNENVYAVEQKLSKLEGSACVIIRRIHSQLDRGCYHVDLTPTELDTLKRFLFIMFFRTHTSSFCYNSPHDPEIANILPWLENLRQRKRLPSIRDTWLYLLYFYLDAPIASIKKCSEAIYDFLGGVDNVVRNLQKLITQNGPLLETFEVIAYHLQTEMYCPSIWIADRNYEFVLGHNSFGLFDGPDVGTLTVHRLYVLSPRVAIVFRNKRYAEGSPDQCLARPDCPLLRVQSYLPITSSRHTDIRLKFKQLSRVETQAVNNLVLRSVQADGTLTFASFQSTARTIRRFCDAPENIDQAAKFPLWLRMPELGLTTATSSQIQIQQQEPSPKSATTSKLRYTGCASSAAPITFQDKSRPVIIDLTADDSEDEVAEVHANRSAWTSTRSPSDRSEPSVWLREMGVPDVTQYRFAGTPPLRPPCPAPTTPPPL
ncbi:hypothetical protein FISHEDRAFT_61043 [Fistulina hepatica ATCC 64428]|uniref:Uncharacterized protein n=1 Tax=Fistulina hepatica ATCC 64428 TaxID=1128425 RepID=A0A0D7A5I6_9AGAR|nr:hypothetical protein FISHEDRAFT_61043 [Fistulina hepatica ATCC 64428]